MPYVSGFDRDQLMCCSWDAFVDEESIVRVIDAFVEHLDIKKLGVKTAAIENAHILRSFYLCCLCRCGRWGAPRMDFSVYRPILQAGNFCAILHFPAFNAPARVQGRSLCENTANSGAKVWYTARFCAILDKKSTQPGRTRHKRGHT